MYSKMIDAACSIQKKVSAAISFFDHPLARILVFILLVVFISFKSFVTLNDHWRTFGSFLLLGIGFTLVLHPADRWSKWAAFFLIGLLVFSPFYWRLQGLDTDGFTITGVLPLSDANGYYTGAVKLLYGGPISTFASRRPLFVVFLSAILFIFKQNLVLPLLAMAFLVSIALFLLALELNECFGVVPSALVTVAMIFCYTGKFAGKFLTEQLGIPLGVLALALLLRGLRRRDFRYISFGVFILTVALNARAGAFIVLPLLVLWGATWGRNGRFSFKHVGILSVCVVFGFMINFLVFKSIAIPGSVPFANFGSTLYGMVTGYRGWQSFYTDYPSLPDQAAFDISLRIFSNSPSPFFMAVLKAYQDFLYPLRYFSFLYLPNASSLLPFFYLLTILTLIGLWKLLRQRNTLFASMMLLIALGVLLSVPFVPPIDDGIRAMTATTAFLCLIAGLSFADLKQFDPADPVPTDGGTQPDWLTIAACSFILLIALGWAGARNHPKTIDSELSCGSGETPVLIPISEGTYLNVVTKSARTTSLVPNIRITDLRGNLAHFPQGSIRLAFLKLQAGQTMLLGFNLNDFRPDSQLIWLIVPTVSVQDFNGVNSYCAVQTHQPVLDRAGLYVERTVKNVFTSP